MLRAKSIVSRALTLQALSLREENEAQDEMDDAAEAAQAAHERRAKEAAKSQRAPKPLDHGGGMFFYERAYWALRRLLSPAASRPAMKPDTAAPVLKTEEQPAGSLGVTTGPVKAAS